MCYYAQYKCIFVRRLRINNVGLPKQCVRFCAHNLSSEETVVGPDYRQVLCPFLCVIGPSPRITRSLIDDDGPSSIA